MEQEHEHEQEEDSARPEGLAGFARLQEVPLRWHDPRQWPVFPR